MTLPPRIPQFPSPRPAGAIVGAVGVAAMLLAIGLAAPTAIAQNTQLPGLIVTVPPSTAVAPPPVAEPPAQPPPKKATPKAAPKAEAKADAKSEARGAGEGRGSGGGQNIVVLVNDEPITGFEIDQRARLLALQANVGARAQENMKRIATSEETGQRWRQIVEQIVRDNQGKTRDQIMAIIEQRRAQFGEGLRAQAIESAKASVLPGLRKTAVEELIEERLKLQEAKRLSATADEVDINNIVNGLAKRNNMTPQQFAEHIKKLGADVESMKARYRAVLSWNEVVRRRFGRDVFVNQLEIDRLISQAPKGDDEVELEVQRIVLAVPGRLDQKAFASRLAEAEKLRANFKGCKSLQALSGSVENAKAENMGVRRPSAFQEPTRTLLMNAKDGEMLPPNPGAGAIELFALCSRKVVAADDKARAEAAAELRQKEFELLARRHLRDLRTEAHIEYR